MNRSAILDKSPVRVSANSNNWAANSAMIAGGKSTTLGLPDKLLKMKERVKRDRSANLAATSHDGGRENSLYGRKRATQDIQNNVQKLRDSYNQHRNKGKSIGASSRGTANMLSKQNFKEAAFDNGDNMSSNSFDRFPTRGTAADKENVLRQTLDS